MYCVWQVVKTLTIIYIYIYIYIYIQCSTILANNTTKKVHTLVHHRHVYYLKSATCFGLHEYLWDIIVTEKNTVAYSVIASTLTRVRKIARSDYYLRHVRPSVCPSAWNNSAPTGRIFIKFEIWRFFRKSVQHTQVSLKSDKNKGHFTWTAI